MKNCLVRRELAFDFLRAKFCLPFLAGHWEGRNTVVDKVHIIFNWLGRLSKASVKQGNGRGNSSGLGFALDGDFNKRIDSGRAVLAGELLNFNVFCRFLPPATGIARLPFGKTAYTCRVHCSNLFSSFLRTLLQRISSLFGLNAVLIIYRSFVAVNEGPMLSVASVECPGLTIIRLTSVIRSGLCSSPP
jgi:hypothetical protein